MTALGNQIISDQLIRKIPDMCKVCIKKNIFTDINLYWIYDRKQSIWYMSNTEWTEFYQMWASMNDICKSLFSRYIEVFWSVLEIMFILMLDCVTFSRLQNKKSKVENVDKQMKNMFSISDFRWRNCRWSTRRATSHFTGKETFEFSKSVEFRVCASAFPPQP